MIGTEVSHSSLSPQDRIDLIHHYSESVANGKLFCVYPLCAYCFRPFHLGLQVQLPTIRGEWGCGCAFLWFDLDPVTLYFKICLVDTIFSNCKVQEVQTCCVQTCFSLSFYMYMYYFAMFNTMVSFNIDVNNYANFFVA